MSLQLATIIPGIFLLLLGGALASGHSLVTATLKSLPRSQRAAYVFFGIGAAWFLHTVWHLSPADFGDYRKLLFIGFGAVAVLSFKFVPDFLAVRGLCVLTLMAASPLLGAAYLEHYEQPQRLFMVSAVYVAIALAIYLGASPFRLRDFFEWLFRVPGRVRILGGALAAYGLLLVGVAFTY
ncbi:MAG: hypothetical protein ABII82_02455 [Verrucomicrobiota bacterium]